MTTVHSVEDIETSGFISSQKQRGIPLNSVLETLNSNQGLFIPFSILEYNKLIGKSDSNAECRSYDSADTQCFRYLLFFFSFFLMLLFLTNKIFWKYSNQTLIQVILVCSIQWHWYQLKTSWPLVKNTNLSSSLKKVTLWLISQSISLCGWKKRRIVIYIERREIFGHGQDKRLHLLIVIGL